MKSEYRTIRVSIEVSGEEGQVLQSTFRSEGFIDMMGVSSAIDRLSAACLSDAMARVNFIISAEYAEGAMSNQEEASS